MSVGKLVAVLAGLAVLGVVAARSDLGQALMGRWSYTKSVTTDRSRFYRLVVNLAYKGEPLTFDMVVGCNVRVTAYKGSDRTVETGVAPTAYGLKMKDGRGIVVRPPEACGGETTENGQVPPTLLPLIVTYENADAPWFGLAYATDDAFESPRSELKFLGATISKASKQEWEDWRRTEAPKNFVTYELLGINAMNSWEPMEWKAGLRIMPYECRGFARVSLSETVREIVRRHWPEDKPAFWYANDELKLALRTLNEAEAERRGLLFEGYQFEQYFPTYSNFFPGLPRRRPGALIFYVRHVAGSVYPARSDLSLNLLDAEGRLPAEIATKTKLSWAEAEVRPELKGFAYCDREMRIGRRPSVMHDPRLPYVNRINGELIREHPDRPSGFGRSNFDYAFERDEYVYFYKSYTLMNIFGGL